MGIDWFGMVFGLGLAVSFGYWCTDFLQVQRVIVAKDLRSAQNGTIIGAVLKMLRAADRDHPGTAGPGRAAQRRRLAAGPGPRERPAGEHHPSHIQRRAAAAHGQVPGPRASGPGGDGDDRRLHVGDGWQRERLRHGLDLRRLQDADQEGCQRRALPEHGPVVLAPGRSHVDRNGLCTLLFLEYPRVPSGAHLLLHRAALRRGDRGHAVEAGDAGRRPSSAS